MPNPVICPKCQRGPLESRGTVFVEEGVYCRSSYEIEGDADKWTCVKCGYTFVEWNKDYENWIDLVDKLMSEFQVGTVVNLKPQVRHPEVQPVFDVVVVEWRAVLAREDGTTWVLKVADRARNHLFITPRQLHESYTMEKTNA